MDLAQEAFLEAWAHMDGFRPGSPFGPWICRIVHNRALNHLERRRHPAAPRLAPGETTPDLPDPRPFPDERLDRHRMTAELQGHVAELPAVLRGAFALRYVDDRPLAEVAAILAVPVNTVKTHLFRAREFLRRRMGRWLHV